MTRPVALLSLRLALLGAMVVGALTFSARQAFAANAAMTCPNDGWNTLGACVDLQACTDACVAVHGPNAQGRCNAPLGCCRCLF